MPQRFRIVLLLLAGSAVVLGARVRREDSAGGGDWLRSHRRLDFPRLRGDGPTAATAGTLAERSAVIQRHPALSVWGRSRIKVEPTPGSLTARRSPPMPRAYSRLMVRPRP